MMLSVEPLGGSDFVAQCLCGSFLALATHWPNRVIGNVRCVRWQINVTSLLLRYTQGQ